MDASGAHLRRFVVLAIGGAFLTGGGYVAASDHNEPLRVANGVTAMTLHASNSGVGDPAADLTDLYAFHTEANIVIALAWRVDPGNELSFDRSMLYGINIDNSAGPVPHADFAIQVRFGKDPAGGYGMKISGLPGADQPLVGAVGKVLTTPAGIRAVEGLFDDPFVFDGDGFFNGPGLSLGNAAVDPNYKAPKNTPFGFNNKNDSFAGTNVHAVVLEIPRGLVLKKKGFGSGYAPLHVWSTASRHPAR